MSDRVRDYYDRNSRRFAASELRRGRKQLFHRYLRLTDSADGTTPDEDGVHHILLNTLRRYADLNSPESLVADLGCGAGGTLSWLAQRTNARLAGLTLSSAQAEMAQRVDFDSRRLTIRVGSFEEEAALTSLTNGKAVTSAYMIEAMVHAQSFRRLFEALNGIVMPGGHLIIIDDIPSASLARMARFPRTPRSRRAARLASAFRQGWKINTFTPVGRLVRAASTVDWKIVEDIDLTRYVVTHRPRDIAARVSGGALRPLIGRFSYLDNLIGGAALQRLIRSRLVRYRLLVFRRSLPSERPALNSGSGNL